MSFSEPGRGARHDADVTTVADVTRACAAYASDPAAREAARDAARARAIPYPLGSGQAEEIALVTRLRPMIRQLLATNAIAHARRRFEAAGLRTVTAGRVYGPTHEGWDDTQVPLTPDAPGARQALFIGRDRAALTAAAACDDAKSDEADLELGRLLGYPRCCVEAFVATGRERRNVELFARAFAATDPSVAPMARTNVLDLAVFHYLSWVPCSFRCAPSIAFADRIAELVARRHPDFVARIDAALAAARLVLADEVQLSLAGSVAREGAADALSITPTQVWPTARDRHPDAALDEATLEAVACAGAAIVPGRALSVARGRLSIDGTHLAGLDHVLLVPFSRE